ncbi:receptor-like protein 12 isoform X1 [Senna tora]|uniref:Receptor-like protein 12 isoform X1 n=1 Tax=Senna tora TaxID=362788 RepID=A0A834T0U1_9FABA|nr:receptor-like protein 12 isoform X1 [Senna tora]
MGRCFCKNSSVVGCLEGERQALLKFKATLIDPSNMLSSWINGSSDCCLWDGISCDNITGHVSKLYLSGNYLEAALDPSLMELHHLSHLDLILDLTYNELEVPILDAFQNLTSVRVLDLSFNNLSSHYLCG